LLGFVEMLHTKASTNLKLQIEYFLIPLPSSVRGKRRFLFHFVVLIK